MAIEINELTAKLNFVRASRMLKGREWIEEHLPLPTSRTEEAETAKTMLKSYLKKRFVGCALRENGETFSVRLDGELHQRVKRVKEIMLTDDHWKRWFQEHHRRLYDEINRHNNTFNGEGIELKEREGQNYLYVPLQISQIQNFQQEGIMRLFAFIDGAYSREAQVANRHEEIIQLMEAERARKAEERRRRIQHDRDRYTTMIHQNLLKHTGTIKTDPKTLEERVAVKMHAWCTAQGINPVVAAEPTYANVVPVGINIEMIALQTSDDVSWIAVPTFGQYEIPEGYELIEGYGEVTAHDVTNARARGGAAPIVAQKYIYLEYQEQFWKPFFPARYDEILEATRRATHEAEAECAAAAEERKAMLAAQEADNATRAAEAKRNATETAIAEQQAKEEKPANDLAASLRAQLEAQKEAQIAVDPSTFPNGIYLNDRAIPLERYVVVHAGRIRRFQNAADANAFAYGRGIEGDALHQVRDYYDIQRVVAEI